MNAQEKAAAALLRLEEFICHISQNYLCWCQLCATGAVQERKGEKRSTVRVDTKNQEERKERCIHSTPHCLTGAPPPVIITIFAQCEPWERGKVPFAPASRRAWCVADVPERLCWTELFSSQCVGLEDDYCDSWWSVVMKEGCGVIETTRWSQL